MARLLLSMPISLARRDAQEPRRGAPIHQYTAVEGFATDAA
jgi:hypothetical protein